VAGTPSLFQIPHSRWNDLPVDALADCGYKVLTRTKDGDVDAFVKQRKSLFVFFQGHPEYESNTLLLEYRREVGRYLRKERETYPAVPEDYLDPEMGDVLAALRQRALSDRNGDLLKDLRAGQIEERIMNTWFPVAATIYGNWLAFLSAQKKRRLTKIPIGKHLHNTQKTDLPLSLAPAETRNLRTKHDPGGLT
jgi:homoserine O-succinyltransferase